MATSTSPDSAPDLRAGVDLSDAPAQLGTNKTDPERRRRLHPRWRRPLVSGLLILASWASAAWLPASAVSLGGWSSTLNDAVGDAFMLAAFLVAGIPIVRRAISALRAKVFSIDLLVSIASIGAILLQNYWEAAAVTFLFSLGDALENATLTRTRSALDDLVATAPDVAIVVRDGEHVKIPAHQVKEGEEVVVKQGTSVPVDGVVVDGRGALDEAAITGESVPVEKSSDDQVFAGTIATAGLLTVRAQGVGGDTTLARIIRRVEDAQDSKARTQTFMERFSAWYTPAIIVLALLTGIISGNVELALTLLVIACPGALVISIPVSIVAGIGRSARDGVLVKGGEFLEDAAKISAVALDKTGTLTRGRPVVVDVVTADGVSREELMDVAARLEAASDHPLAEPIVRAAREMREGREERDVVSAATKPAGPAGSTTAGSTTSEVSEVQLPTDVDILMGQGLTGTLDGRRVAIGNGTLARSELERVGRDARSSARADQLVAATDAQAEQGRTPVIVSVDGAPWGVIAVADQVRDEAKSVIERLHRAGIREVVMLTGDQPKVANAVAAQVGIDTVKASLLPEEKLEEIHAMQERGLVVAMVGDGVNDAPALATADIGVAMGAAGSAIAVETADIALMADDLERLPGALTMSKRTVRVMRQNIAVALLTVAVLMVGVFAGGVTMSIGMLVHELSVLVVIVNAMRLMRPVTG